MLRPLAHLASLLAVGVWAVALGRWLRDPQAGGSALALLALALVIAVAVHRLYRPDGVASIGRAPAPPREAPAPAAAPVAPEAAAAVSHLWADDGRVDVNTADAEDLQQLPGVGPVAARRILGERAAGGPFASVEDLVRVPGFGPAKVRALADRARV